MARPLLLVYTDQNRSRRAGLKPDSPAFEFLLRAVLASSSISLYGFYTHAGHSYASTSFAEAADFLLAEVNAVNDAATLALSIIANTPGMHHPREAFVLSVGATPTAHAATEELKARVESGLNGVLELHAGLNVSRVVDLPAMLITFIRQLPSAGPPTTEHKPYHSP